jgi:hypothetical protein
VTSYAVKHRVAVMTPTEVRIVSREAAVANARSAAVLHDADEAIREAREAQRALHDHWKQVYEERTHPREPA